MIKRLKAEDNPKRVLKLEEDQRYTSVLPAVRAKKAATKDAPEKHRARENSLLEATAYARKGGSLKTSL